MRLAAVFQPRCAFQNVQKFFTLVGTGLLGRARLHFHKKGFHGAVAFAAGQSGITQSRIGVPRPAYGQVAGMFRSAGDNRLAGDLIVHERAQTHAQSAGHLVGPQGGQQAVVFQSGQEGDGKTGLFRQVFAAEVALFAPGADTRADILHGNIPWRQEGERPGRNHPIGAAVGASPDDASSNISGALSIDKRKIPAD